VYLGYAIGGGELRIDFTEMEAIIKCLVPSNVTKVRIFFGETQYLGKLMASFLVVVVPLHGITRCGECFHWGKNQ
jgi:hypothetical protein